MTLIERLRTGAHEQAVGLLLEVQEAVKPQPSIKVVDVWEQWHVWKAAFKALLRIGTPEACVGAAMMLKPEGWSYVIREGFVELRHPTNSTKDVTGISASTALALAAAIMEARNG